MKPIVIFGIGKIADVVQFFMREESDYEVVAFTVDSEYLPSSKKFADLPVVSFETLEEHYSPETHDLFVAVGYHEMNELRSNACERAIDKGYKLISFIHPNSGVPKDLIYGDNCFIMNNVCIHPRVKLGDNVFVWSGAMVGHHSVVGSHTWITSTVNIGGNVEIGEKCFLAINSTISHSMKIGNEVFLGANTLVTKNLNDGQVVIAESHKPIRLNSKQFLKMSSFTSL